VPYGRAVKVVCQVDQRGVIYRLLCLHNASNEFIFYAYRFIKYFDTKLDRVRIHNSSFVFALGDSGKSLMGKIWLTGHSLNESAVWNITKATMHIL
jgi:hypothetical protein